MTNVTFTVNVVLNVGVSPRTFSCPQDEMMVKVIEFKNEISERISADSMWNRYKIVAVEIVIESTQFENLSK